MRRGFLWGLQFNLWTHGKGSTIDSCAEFIAIQIINHGLIQPPEIVAVIHDVEIIPLFLRFDHGFMALVEYIHT